MYSKIILPKQDGVLVYHNKSSSAKLLNYLAKELKGKNESQETAIFFNPNGNFSKAEVLKSLDNNVKGLRAEDDKFYSLVLSPSEEELKHISNDDKKLRDFTLASMKNYADNFHLQTKDRREKKISEKDLLWFATIHHNRHFKGNSPEVVAGMKKQGDLKVGLNTHIHITVSARDNQQKITLNPSSDKKRFSRVEWAVKNQQSFNQLFKFKSQEKPFDNLNRKVAFVEKQLSLLEKKNLLSADEIKFIREVASEKKYSDDFCKKLGQITKNFDKEPNRKGLEKEEIDLLKSSKTNHKDFAENFGKTKYENQNEYEKGMTNSSKSEGKKQGNVINMSFFGGGEGLSNDLDKIPKRKRLKKLQGLAQQNQEQMSDFVISF